MAVVCRAEYFQDCFSPSLSWLSAAAAEHLSWEISSRNYTGEDAFEHIFSQDYLETCLYLLK